MKRLKQTLAGLKTTYSVSVGLPIAIVVGVFVFLWPNQATALGTLGLAILNYRLILENRRLSLMANSPAIFVKFVDPWVDAEVVEHDRKIPWNFFRERVLRVINLSGAPLTITWLEIRPDTWDDSCGGTIRPNLLVDPVAPVFLPHLEQMDFKIDLPECDAPNPTEVKVVARVFSGPGLLPYTYEVSFSLAPYRGAGYFLLPRQPRVRLADHSVPFFT